MLIDDNKDDNYVHKRVIKKSGVAETVIVMDLATKALEYLKSKEEHPHAHPDLIFLDIRMPLMNGWEFLDEYSKLDKEFQSTVVITMLTTSTDPDDKTKALSYNIPIDFRTKPLTEEMLEEIIVEYFSAATNS